MQNPLTNGLLSTWILLLFSACGSVGSDSEGEEPVLAAPFAVQVSVAQSPQEYIDQLGCFSCHGGSEMSNQLETKAPDLSHAGLRYKPEYVFHYLQNPTRIRNHIGLSRMPNFGFDEKEALAVTLYLTDQKDRPNVQFPDFGGEGDIILGKQYFGSLACTSCHTVNGESTFVVSDLSNMGSKLRSDWTKQFIAAPSVFRGRENIMPSLLYHFETDSTGLVASMEDADFKVKSLSTYLMSLEAPDHDEQLDGFESTRSSNPGITAEIGKKIYQSQNCAGCHRSNDDGQWRKTVGPDLLTISTRINKSWLANYLKKPHVIRPFGFYPGSGSRMPNFGLSEVEVENIVDFLLQEDTLKKEVSVQKPSRFISNKIETLLDEKFPCLGCHSLNGVGGKIGPDLANLSSRLDPEYLALVVSNPDSAIAGTIMPQISMPTNLRDQLIAYLIHNKDSVPTSDYLSLVDHPIILPAAHLSSEDVYLSKCGICHGAEGDGDGFNSDYLATQPTVHSDGVYMSGKPDDTLFDGVYAGGAVLNKSHLMPAWGNTLSTDQIQGLVKYMRNLCDCVPPKWSTDNRTSN